MTIIQATMHNLLYIALFPGLFVVVVVVVVVVVFVGLRTDAIVILHQ